MQNNCDGSGPHLSGEVRTLPLGTDPYHGNLIFCRACFEREIVYRKDRGWFDLPAWSTLAVYATS